MKFIKLSMIGLSLFMVSASYATDYYVSVNGAGNKDGSSWEMLLILRHGTTQ